MRRTGPHRVTSRYGSPSIGDSSVYRYRLARGVYPNSYGFISWNTISDPMYERDRHTICARTIHYGWAKVVVVVSNEFSSVSGLTGGEHAYGGGARVRVSRARESLRSCTANWHH